MAIIDSAKITQQEFSRLSNLLKNGDCIGLPTETVYGLAADATNGIGVARIFELKGRPSFNPLICHVSNLEMAKTHGIFSDIAIKLADAFWPGPLTLILPLKEDSDIHPLVTAELATIGLRHPKGFATLMIEQFGKPIAAPSANPSGKISPTMASHVSTAFPELTIIDHGACEIGLESTIVKIIGRDITLLRPGAVTSDMIEDAIGLKPATVQEDTIEAPGMMKSHYAPDASLRLNVTKFTQASAILGFGKIEIEDTQPIFNLSERGDLREAASNLYAGLKALDASGVEQIEVSPIPNEGLGLAINDRLARAAAPRECA